MRDLIHIGAAILVAATAALATFAALAIDIRWPSLALTAGTGLYAGLLVLLGESIIEDVVKAGILMLLGGLLWANHDGLFPVFLCTCIAGLTGTAVNQLNRTAAARALRRGS